MKNNLFTISQSAHPLGHLLILSSFILSSCTSTKHLQKDKTEIKTEISTNEKNTSYNQLMSNTRIIESQDTFVLIKGSELTASANFNNLLSGDTIFASGESLVLKTFYDSLTKTIKTQAKVKSQSVSFKYKKITEKQELQTGTIASTKQVLQTQSIQSVNKAKEITRSSPPSWVIIMFVFALIGIIGLVVLKLKRYV